MIKITIIAVGKIKKDYFRDGINEYLKRLSIDAKINIEEVNSEPFFDNSDYEKIKKAEGEKVLKFINKYSESKIIILDERGKEFQSKEFANFLSTNIQEHLVFIVGGTLGFSEEVLNYSGAVKMAISKMTLPHEMVRMILVEQIYRAIAINKNKKYHY